MTIDLIERRVIACRACPDLATYIAAVGREKKRAFRDQPYWAKPVPGFGDPAARVLLVGLAPGAHGSNRTGRMFTGDASGDWLFRALNRAGFANQAVAIDRNDGLVLHDAFITAAGRCAPPKNKPTPAQLANCFPFLVDEIRTLAHVRVIVTLGKIADDTIHTYVKRYGRYVTPRKPFAHGRENAIALPVHGDVTVISSYHPSRQNTNTGVLTEPMLDAIFSRARDLTSQRSA